VFGELYGETVEGTLMQTGNESLHNLSGQEFKVTEGPYFRLIDGHDDALKRKDIKNTGF